MQSLNVLIVDDSMLAVQVLKNALEELGHKVVKTAGTGVAALAAYKACNPDIVTMDITMPDMDGIVATGNIVKAFPDARVIMVTSHAAGHGPGCAEGGRRAHSRRSSWTSRARPRRWWWCLA
jgi:two-component system chemotaxis response regulator CheY